MKLPINSTRKLPLALVAIFIFLAAVFPLRAQEAPHSASTPPQGPTLYVVGYAHLDTQWRWSYPQVIAEFLRHTMEDNFKLFEKYPHYVFNFTGANRYLMMKEYYPEDYKKLQAYVKAGRWFPAGSSMEEGDANMPNCESIIRQVLYGNEVFRRDFGMQSEEFMLPDCFGFQASLPSILAHCGIKGFSTAKLTWGSAVGIPFNVGVWVGPDGKSVIAALNPGAYDSGVTDDQSKDAGWIRRINADGRRSGVFVDYRYYGVGDRGGAAKEASVQWVEKSVTGTGPVHVISGTSDQMFKDLSAAQVAELPRYQGDLLLTNHSAGSLSSQAFVKRTNRKLEELGDAAERAAVTADWLGSSPYPREKLFNAWTLQLGAHFHDTMAGTALPKSYEYTWNNMVLALNQFAAVAQDGVGGMAAAMDTRGEGTPIVVYNPLSIDREDIAEATIQNAPASFDVVGPDAKPVPFQIVSQDDHTAHILFLARVPSVGAAIFSVRPAAATAEQSSHLKVSDHALENEHLRVTLNADGDIASIFDKQVNREALAAPARLEFLHENPGQFPAWNMDWEDRNKPPVGYVDGPCAFRIVENGPVRVAIETQRHARGSTIMQTIRLSAGAAGDKVEVLNHIDWQSREVSLEAAFPMSVGNPLASYESQSCAVQRPNNNPKKFEVPQQQWLDLTATDGSFGTAILNDCKYGSDKPDDSTIRLTLLYTPGTRGGYQDQGTQDLGRHEFIYAIAPHARGWQQGHIPWSAQRLNQPLLTFTSASHEGSLGKSVSIAKVNKEDVSISAMKKAEEGDEIIIRLHETDGTNAPGTRVSFVSPILSAHEVDGQERPISKASLVDGKLVTDMTPFSLRAFAVKLAPPASKLTAPMSQPVELAYDLDAVSTHENLTDGAFDKDGHTYAAEALPPTISSEGIEFKLGPTRDGKNNALICKGQTLQLPAGFDRVYLLAAAAEGDVPATFQINGAEVHRTIQNWSGYVGQWDNRIWRGVVPELTYDFTNKFAGLVPGFVKQSTVAWFCSHRHDPAKGNEFYKFTYLFKYGFDLPRGATAITLPNNENIRIFAVSAGKSSHDQVDPARPLYDTLQDHQYLSPTITPPGGKFSDTVACSIDRTLYGKAGDIHFTTDGSEPTAQSPVYAHPIFLSGNTTVRARQIDGGGMAGAEASQTYEINDTTAPVLTSASALSGALSISVAFSKPVQKESAETVSNYVLSPKDDEVLAANLDADQRTVTLTLAQLLPKDAKPELTVKGVTDLAPAANKIVPKSTPVTIQSPVVTVDRFVADGNTTREFKSPDVSGRSQSPWTISFFVRVDQQPEDRTLIAGFGTNRDQTSGAGRFICKFQEGIHYWSRNQDVTGTDLDTGRWQLLTATYDGSTLSLYKNGTLIKDQPLELSDDDTTVRLAPPDPWDHSRRFKGEIRNFQIWPVALKAADVSAMMAGMPK